MNYASVAADVLRRLPPGPRVSVMGSTSFYGADSPQICKEIGKKLTEIEGRKKSTSMC